MTWREIKDRLASLTNDQLDQVAQILPHYNDDSFVVPLEPIFALGTIKELGTQTVRTADQNQHRPDQFVMAVDLNPFAPDGSIAIDLISGDKIFPRLMV